MRAGAGWPRASTCSFPFFLSCPCLLTLLTVLASLAAAGTAGAATVVLVRPPRPNAVAAEATVRLQGELVAAGFEVRLIDPPPGADLRSSLEEAAAGPDVEAVVAITGEAMGIPFADSAELWVIDRVTGKTVVRRVPNQLGAPRAAELLSIRALELLRASFLEVALGSSRVAAKTPAAPPPIEVVRWTSQALRDAAPEPEEPATWAVEVGAAVLASPSGLSAALLPTLRLERRFGEAFLGRLTVAGFGTPSRVDVPAAASLRSADVVQQFGLLEAVLRFRSGARVQPFVCAGVGGLHIAARGEAASPYHGIDSDVWALVVGACAGLRFPVLGRFELSLDVAAQAANPYPVIQFNGMEIARMGRPTLLGGVTLVAWM